MANTDDEYDDHYLSRELFDLVRSDPEIFHFIKMGVLDGLWYWDLEHPEHEWMSPTFWRTFGYEPQDKKHLASEWQEMIHPDDLTLSLDNFNKHAADPNYPYDQVVRYTHKDGSTVWVRCRGLIIRDAEGKPLRMLGAHVDVTEQQRIQASLRRIYEETPALMYGIDRKGRIEFVSDLWLSHFGYTREAVVGQPYMAFLTQESHAWATEEM
ncbi:MAG: PAS domain-containing protein, partial [Myxococcota bacterium]